MKRTFFSTKRRRQGIAALLGITIGSFLFGVIGKALIDMSFTILTGVSVLTLGILSVFALKPKKKVGIWR